MIATLLLAPAVAVASQARQAPAAQEEQVQVDPCELAILRALLGLEPLSRAACPHLAALPAPVAKAAPSKRPGRPAAASTNSAPTRPSAEDVARLAEAARVALAKADAAEREAAAAEARADAAEARVSGAETSSDRTRGSDRREQRQS